MSMDEQVYEDVAEAYRGVIGAVLDYGEPVPCREKPTLELLDHSFTVLNPRMNLIPDPARKFNYRYMVQECMWNLCDTADIRPLVAVHPGITKFVQDQEERDYAKWAYGPQIHGDLRDVYELLRDRPDTRRALLRPGKSTSPGDRGSGTPPCLELVHFVVRGGDLHLMVTMRSNDAFLGMPYDIFTYTTWQCAMAEALGLKVGTYRHRSDSMHVYVSDRDRAESAADEDHPAVAMGWKPDMTEAFDGALLRDVETAADYAEQGDDPENAGEVFWTCRSWAPGLAAVAGDWGGMDDTLRMLRDSKVGVRWE